MSQQLPDAAPDRALERLRRRDEVLEICFWYRGEGFGEIFTAGALKPFLNTPGEEVEAALTELVAAGQMQALARGYAFTDAGRRQAGRMFAESFVDFQRPAHGECEGDCCGEDEHQDHHHTPRPQAHE
jgi:hypothetical protein